MLGIVWLITGLLTPIIGYLVDLLGHRSLIVKNFILYFLLLIRIEYICSYNINFGLIYYLVLRSIYWYAFIINV